MKIQVRLKPQGYDHYEKRCTFPCGVTSRCTFYLEVTYQGPIFQLQCLFPQKLSFFQQSYH